MGVFKLLSWFPLYFFLHEIKVMHQMNEQMNRLSYLVLSAFPKWCREVIHQVYVSFMSQSRKVIRQYATPVIRTLVPRDLNTRKRTHRSGCLLAGIQFKFLNFIFEIRDISKQIWVFGYWVNKYLSCRAFKLCTLRWNIS